MAGVEEDVAGRSKIRHDPEVVRHYLAKCVLKGSAVLHAVRGHFRSQSSSDVVFGKETSIELAEVGEDGIIESISEQTVFGTIKDLSVLSWHPRFQQKIPQTEGKDLLVVLSDSGKLSFLTFSFEMRRFFALKHIQLSNPGNSMHQLGRLLAVDSGGSYVAVSAYEYRFAIFSLFKTTGVDIVDESIYYPTENEATTLKDSQRTNIRGTIWNMCFISQKSYVSTIEGSNPMLAIIINRKGSSLNELLVLDWNFKNQTVHIVTRFCEAGPLALNISEVLRFPGFALLFRVGDVLVMDIRDPKDINCIQRINFSLSPEDELTAFHQPFGGLDVDDEGISNVAACALLELRDSGDDLYKYSDEDEDDEDDPMVTDDGKLKLPCSKYACSWSWEPVDSAYSTLMLCLDTGEMFVVVISSDGQGIRVDLSDCIYRSSPCKILAWFSGGLILGIVEMGDGLVFKFEYGQLSYKGLIQNIAPILDFSIADYHEDKQEQIFACCGMSPEGSVRVIRSGINIERLLRTDSVYQGTTGAWTLKMKISDPYHSFLVLSFVEETRVLSVGLSFLDITDAVGFHSNVCTLACGLVADRLLVQIHKDGVSLCLPSRLAHCDGIAHSTPHSAYWRPHNTTICKGAIGENLIVLATSSPCILFIVGIRFSSLDDFELYELQNIRMHQEVSCIFVPRVSLTDKDENAFQNKLESGITLIVGTHRPSVEILSFDCENGFKLVATGIITGKNTWGAPVSGCIPEDVRLVSVDKPYVLCGLRNGMLLRFESPVLNYPFHKMDTFQSSSIVFHDSVMEKTDKSAQNLQLISVRRVGVTPVMLVGLHDSLDADIVVLSDRPWLLHAGRHSLSYTSISFQPSIHACPVCSPQCPKGILFVAENSLHLVEMVRFMRFNVQKFPLWGNPRKVLYHSESKTLLVLRTGISTRSCSSDICRVDPVSGLVLSKFDLPHGETAKCMQIAKMGNEWVLVVGTCLSKGPIIMPSGEPESSVKGRLLVLCLDMGQSSLDNGSTIGFSNSGSSSQITSPLREVVGYAGEQLSGGDGSLRSSPDDPCFESSKVEEADLRQFRVLFQQNLSGAVLSVCPYLDHYVLASSGNSINIFGFLSDSRHRLKKLAATKTRFTITCIKTYFTRIAVGDCRDGILFYSYHEDLRKLEQMYSDPVQRLVADCCLVDMDTAVVSDRRGTLAVLSCKNHTEGNESPEKNLLQYSSFYLGETVMNLQKGSFLYKFPSDDPRSFHGLSDIVPETYYNSILASTLLGGLIALIPITREEHNVLEYVESKLAVHPLTSPILGNDSREFRGRKSQAGVPTTILDGDMLSQFLELTISQQELVLMSSGPDSSEDLSLSSASNVSIDRVVRLLERIHYTIS